MAKKKGKRGKGRKHGSHTKSPRKSAKRAAAARKAARTRAEKHAARSRAARKAARTRAHKHGHRGHAMEPKKGKRGKGKKSSGKRKKRTHNYAEQLQKTKNKLATVQARYKEKISEVTAKLKEAEGVEKQRLIKRIERLERQKNEELLRLQNLAAKQRMKIESLQSEAAERRRRGKGRKHRKGHGRRSRRRNPIDGMGQNLAAAGGALTGILLTVVPYRLIRSHKLAAAGQGQGGAGMIDQPAQGDVPNLSTAQLPFYAKMKWKGAIALGVYILGDVVLPFTAAHMADRHPKTKSFFQVWGWTAVALGGTKAVVDVAAMAMKNTAIGQRLFAPENTARTLRAMSANAPLPAISVAPGLGLPGLTGYGKPPTTGAGCGCGGNCGTCTDCKAKAGQPAQPGNMNPGGSAPAPTTSVPGSAPASMTGAGNPPPAAPEHASPSENVVIQGHFAPKPTPPGRFAAKRFTT